MKNEYEEGNFEELSYFAISFAGSRMMPPAILGGFTLSAIFFLNSVAQSIIEWYWADTLGIIFYICFMLFIITSIFFDIFGGQAQKLEFKNLDLSEKKKKIIGIINKINVTNKLLLATELIMICSMIYSGVMVIMGG
ncbi:MAG: hypothetical protein ACXAC5_06045 [Promethearchaeota archaeon]|jgi:hypothetical protein